MISILVTGCTLRARNQDKFNRLLALSNLAVENSTLSISSKSLSVGESAIVTLTIKDKNLNPSTVSGLTVSFALSGSTSAGSFSPALDNGDGKFTSVFTATAPGAAATLSATVLELGPVPQTLTVTVDKALSSNRTFPVDGSNPPLIQGTSYTFDFGIDNQSDARSDTQYSMTLGCTYQTLGLHSSDPNYAVAGTNCAQLNSLTTSESPDSQSVGKASFNLGKLKWTPTFSQRGTYQFTVNVSDGKSSSSKSLTVSVRENSTTAHLLSAVDALFATSASGLSSSTAASPANSTDPASTWLNLIGSASHGSCTFGSSTPWAGTGQTSLNSVDPYRIHFNSVNSDSMSLGSVLNSSNQFAVQTWVKPSSPSTGGTVIASNGGGDGNGFVLRQSTIPTGKAEFAIGKKYYSYKDLVLSSNPIGYWRLGETSGTTATDLSFNGNNGTYSGGYTQGQTGIISGDSDPSTLFNGTTGYVTMGDPANMEALSAVSLSAWVNASDFSIRGTIVAKEGIYKIDFNTNGTVRFLTGNNWAGSILTSTTALTTNTWNHIVATYDGSVKKLYINGVLESSTVSTTGATGSNTNQLLIGAYNSAATYMYFLPGKIDDVSIYNYALSPTQITEHYQTGKNGNYKPYPGNTVLADNPLGYWRLGEKSGKIAYDSSGNNYHATYTSPVSLNEAGAISNDNNGSAFFNGTGTAVDAGNITALNGLRQTTVEAWVKTTTLTQWSGLVGKTFSNSNRILMGTAGPGYGGGSQDAWISFANGSSSHWAHTTTNVVTTGVWQHWVAVFNGYGATNADRVKFYINGVQQSLTINATPTTLGTNTTSLSIGASSGISGTWKGYIDDVAIYNYALSPTQIAAHYNSGAGSAWWTCQSLTDLSTPSWNLLSAIYDGTTAKLFVNGQQECSVNPGTTYSGSTANTTVGSNPARTSGFWNGAMSVFKIFGTSDSSAPIDVTSIKNDFDVEGERFRATPLDRIIRNGLVFNLDAANAKQGLAPYTNGCANSDLSWSDLSSNLFTGTLLNFQSCGTSEGWVGDGTVSNPYALVFNSAHTNYVTLPSSTSNFNSANTTFTVSGWFKTTSTNFQSLVAQGGTGSANINGWTVFTSGGKLAVYIKASSGAQTKEFASTQTYNDDKWHHFAAILTTDTSTMAGNAITFYVDGALAAGNVSSQTSLPYGGNPNLPLLVGARGTLTSRSTYFTGSIATTQIYSRGLSSQEVKQNCLAQESRFTSTAQSICGAP